MKRGYFGIGIFNGKTPQNLGTLWRSAQIMGASFLFTIGKRYKHQPTDTTKAHRNIPYYHYEDFAAFKQSLPDDCQLVAIELAASSVALPEFKHPPRVAYLLGAEDTGLTDEVLIDCNSIVQLPGDYSMNVAVAGSIVMYDRYGKRLVPLTDPAPFKAQFAKATPEPAQP